jgi:hypothetical protein
MNEENIQSSSRIKATTIIHVLDQVNSKRFDWKKRRKKQIFFRFALACAVLFSIAFS